MKTLNPIAVWRDIEEHLAPAFQLRPSDRVVYLSLVRRSRFRGKRVLRVAARALARATMLSRSTIRTVLRRLSARNLVTIRTRDLDGFDLVIKLPREIPGCVAPTRSWDGRNMEDFDFWTSNRLRGAIYRREDYRCFYCRRRLVNRAERVLDHVVPRARDGKNSYRNLVASCLDCNILKRDRPAPDLLRRLVRDHLITRADLQDRLRSLRHLASGKLKPSISLNTQTRCGIGFGDSRANALPKASVTNRIP